MKKNLFFISDIHGCFNEMITALKEAGYDKDDQNNLLVVLGDNFDRGSESLAVYEYLKALTDEGKAVVVKGNHDTMLEEYLDGSCNTPWNYFKNGTDETLAEFLHRSRPFESWLLIDKKEDVNPDMNANFEEWIKGARKEINEEYPELLPWLKNLPRYFESQNYIGVHGAIDVDAEDWHEPNCELYGLKGWDALDFNDGTFFGKEITNTKKKIIIGHFGTYHLREMYGLKDSLELDFSTLKRGDGRIIAIDTTTPYSKKVNVFVVESEELLNDVEERR